MTTLGASSRVFELLDRKPQISTSGTEKPSEIKGHIKLENVTFTYPTRPDRVVLDDISIEVPEGKVLALVGHSGSGKSTISALLTRFYDPQNGKIFLDGNELRDLDAGWLRDNIGVVSQEVTLFQGTLAENIAYGCEGKTKEEIEKAAKEANAHGKRPTPFIYSFLINYL